MDIPGLPARRAALNLIDAVLRRGETLDQAAGTVWWWVGAISRRLRTVWANRSAVGWPASM